MIEGINEGKKEKQENIIRKIFDLEEKRNSECQTYSIKQEKNKHNFLTAAKCANL